MARKLVDAKVNGIVSQLNSGTSVPASRIYHNASLVQVSPATTATQFTKQKFPGVFRVVANDARLGGMLASTRSRRSRSRTMPSSTTAPPTDRASLPNLRKRPRARA